MFRGLAMDSADQRDSLRRRIRETREALDPERRREDAGRVASVLAREQFVVEARHVAGYHAVGGELDPASAMAQCADHGATLYLPVLDRDSPRTLEFRQWSPGTPLNRNRLGIPEPEGTPARDPRELDLVFVPLVACDPRGNRIGMGGGFYDTTFAWRIGGEPGRPRLVGMAYDFQVVESLPAMPWDVPLTCIATPQGLIVC